MIILIGCIDQLTQFPNTVVWVWVGRVSIILISIFIYNNPEKIKCFPKIMQQITYKSMLKCWSSDVKLFVLPTIPNCQRIKLKRKKLVIQPNIFK